MQFGHYSPRELREITEVLNLLGVPFTVQEDLEILERERQQARVRFSAPTPQGEIRHVWVEVADEDLPRLGDRLKNHGISIEALQEPVFAEPKDYVCPKCKYSSPEPGICPEHDVSLTEFSELMNQRRVQESQSIRKNFWIFIGVIIVIVYVVYHFV